MPMLTVIFGVLFMLLGVGGYIATERESVTALIPAIFGVLFILLGSIAMKPKFLKHAMHAAALLAILGFAATVRALPSLPDAFADPVPEGVRRPAIISQSLMAGLSLIFVILCVMSFVKARKARAGA